METGSRLIKVSFHVQLYGQQHSWNSKVVSARFLSFEGNPKERARCLVPSR
jgi:hypothetical protein